MDYIYIFWVIIVLVDFIILRKIAQFYIDDSNSNSIKTEESMMFQAFIVLILGLVIVLSIFISPYIKVLAQEVIFLGECFFCLINFVWFLSILFKQLGNSIRYQKGGSIKLVIYSHFLKNLVLIYLLYNYYDLIIK